MWHKLGGTEQSIGPEARESFGMPKLQVFPRVLPAFRYSPGSNWHSFGLARKVPIHGYGNGKLHIRRPGALQR